MSNSHRKHIIPELSALAIPSPKESPRELEFSASAWADQETSNCMKCQIYLTPTSMIQPIFSKPSSRAYQPIIGKKERHLYKIQNEGLESVKFNIIMSPFTLSQLRLTFNCPSNCFPDLCSLFSTATPLCFSTAVYLKPQTQSLTLYVLSLQACLIPFRLFMNSHDLHPKSS